MYPNNVPIVIGGADAVPDGLFNDNATGRVLPVGTFSGFEDSIEYFWGLAPIASDMQAAFYRVDVAGFTSGCPNVAASQVYLRAGFVDLETGELDESKPTTSLAQVSAAPRMSWRWMERSW